MPVRHHPSAQVRADYVAATLAPGAALAVRTHLEYCTVCSIAVQAMDGYPEAAGQSTPPTFGVKPAPQAAAGPHDLPPILQGIPRTPWTHIGGKVRGARLEGVSGLGEAVWLVELAQGGSLASGPPGMMWGVVVLKGAARDQDATFQTGDFVDLTARSLAGARAESNMLLLLVCDDSWGRPIWRRALDLLAQVFR